MSDIYDLEKQLAEAKELTENRQLALRLYKNRDFKKLIIDQFCTTEAARYVQVSGDPALKAEERADALAMAQASGHLKRYLSMVVQMGAASERDLPAIEEALVEARQYSADVDVVEESE